MTEPYYQDEHVTLYHGDCLQITEWLDADVLITDPPYGIAWTPHGLSRVSARDRRAGHSGKAYFTMGNPLSDTGIANDDTSEARDAALKLWGVKPAIVFGSLLLAPPEGTKQVAIYKKPKDSGNFTSVGGVRRDVEGIYFLGKHKIGGGGRSAVFPTQVAVAGSSSGLAARYGHPHVKPGDVLEALIELTSGVIADPFAGSGSTLVAAKALGRHAIGVELEEQYCETAARRLAQGVLDLGGDAA